MERLNGTEPAEIQTLINSVNQRLREHIGEPLLVHTFSTMDVFRYHPAIQNRSDRVMDQVHSFSLGRITVPEVVKKTTMKGKRQNVYIPSNGFVKLETSAYGGQKLFKKEGDILIDGHFFEAVIGEDEIEKWSSSPLYSHYLKVLEGKEPPLSLIKPCRLQFDSHL